MRLLPVALGASAIAVLLAGCQLLSGADETNLDGTGWVATSVAGRPLLPDANALAGANRLEVGIGLLSLAGEQGRLDFAPE